MLFINSCCKPLKTDPYGRYVPLLLEKSLFYQIHTLVTDLCMLLLNLKISITASRA